MMWAGLGGAERAIKLKLREAKPGCVAAQRFFVAANWLTALLEPGAETTAVPQAQRDAQDETMFPLIRRVYPQGPLALPRPSFWVSFDASPWGGGGVFYE